MSDDLVKRSIAELQDIVRCRCHPAYKDRGLHDPDCECDSAEAVQVVADRIEELEAKLAKLARAAKPFAAIKIKDGRSQPGEIGRTDVTNLRAALAELKGEDRG
jgi:hypothetical protein